jgi:lipopolysaccharide biosynthesis glycosyltransferase
MNVPYVFSIDKNFVLPFKVLLFSLRETLSLQEHASIFILHDSSISETLKKDLAQFAGSQSINILFVDISRQLCLLPPLRDSSHVSQLTFARLFIASVLPSTINSAIYIDADTLVIDQITYLQELNLTQPIAACDHCSPFDQLRIHGEEGGSYFQAGLLRIDLEDWRNTDVMDKFMNVINNSYDRILWWDQDVLNIVFKDKWQRLPVSYNLCRVVRESLDNPQHSIKLDQKLIHFDGGHRPWVGFRDDHYGVLWYSAFKRAFGFEHPLLAYKPHTLNSRNSILKKIKLKVERIKKYMFGETIINNNKY